MRACGYTALHTITHTHTHLLHEFGRCELLGDLGVHLLLFALLHFGPLDLQFLDAGDVPGELELGYEVGLLGQVGLALEALQTQTPRRRRERLRGDHLVGPAQLHRVQVLDADGRQGLLLFLGGVGVGVGLVGGGVDGKGRRRRSHSGVVLLLHGHDRLLALRVAPEGRGGGALVADALQVLGGLDEVVGVGAAGEAGRDEGQHPLLVHQVGSVLLRVVGIRAQTDNGQVRAGGIEPFGS